MIMYVLHDTLPRPTGRRRSQDCGHSTVIEPLSTSPPHRPPLLIGEREGNAGSERSRGPNCLCEAVAFLALCERVHAAVPCTVPQLKPVQDRRTVTLWL